MKKNDRISVDEAAKILHKRPQYVRVGLQNDTLPIRSCNKEERW